MTCRGTWALLLFLLGCGIPADPEGTLEAVRHRPMRVGVSENPPWIVREAEQATGVEAELIEMFAERAGTRVQWIWGTTENHLIALEGREIDLVAAGLTDETAWKKKVAVTRPYFESPIRVGLSPSRPGNLPLPLAGRIVAVPLGAGLARLVEKRGARALPLADPWQHRHPVAAPEWELDNRGYRFERSLELGRQKHVMVAGPGENRFLVQLERTLLERKSDVTRLLRQAAR